MNSVTIIGGMSDGENVYLKVHVSCYPSDDSAHSSILPSVVCMHGH